MLASLGVAGALGLAGCGGDGGDGDSEDPTTTTDDGTGTTSDGTTTTANGDVAHVSGQEFVWRLPHNNPELLHFYWGFDNVRWLEGGTDLVQSDLVRFITHPRGFIANWDGNSDQVQAFQSDPIEEVRWMEPTIVTGDDVVGDDHIPADRAIQYEITEDIPMWNDGQELTATDFLPQQLYSRTFGGGPYDKFANSPEDNRAQDGWAEVGFPDGRDGKKVQFTDPWGAIEQMGGLRDFTWFHLWRGGAVLGGINPSHHDPWQSGVENGLELIDQLAEQVANGESTDNMPGRERFVLDHTPLDIETIEDYEDPDNALCYGPWQPAQKEGAQALTLEPNPEWNGPEPNFDSVRLTFAPEDQAAERITAAFQSGEYDFLAYNFEQSVIDQAPDKYDQVTVTSENAQGLTYNNDHKDLGNRNVRAAIYYAIDQETLSSLVAPNVTEAYTQPATDLIGMDRLGDTLSQEWIDENLIDYSYDVERADQLMQDEGYERNSNGLWENSDGEEMSFDFPTDSQDTTFQQAVSDMLGDWGIELNLRTVDTATFEDSRANGQYDIWSAPHEGDWPWFPQPARAYFFLAETDDRLDYYGLYPQDDTDEALEITGDDDFVTREADDHLNLQVPPIGEPDGERSEFAATDTVRELVPSGSSTQLASADSELLRKFYWTYNWHLPQMILLKGTSQWWMNTQNWDWSPTTDHFLWTESELGTSYPDARYSLSQGDWILADPDNPKEGAEVED